LQKGSLDELRGLGESFITTLQTATKVFGNDPKVHYHQKNLELAIQAMRLFGVAWAPELIQERGFDALCESKEAARGAECSRGADHAMWALTHLAPFFSQEQRIVLANAEPMGASGGMEHRTVLENLYLASPRQSLMSEGYYPAYDWAVDSLRAARKVVERQQEIFSDPNTRAELNPLLLVNAATRAIHSVCLLIPELAVLPAGSEREDVKQEIDKLVDILSWFIEASGQMGAVKRGEVSLGVPMTQ
jgi:hypothetical protein